jgi:4-diphosphocytidyl-2-C-methyl-D-erythritol kinase
VRLRAAAPGKVNLTLCLGETREDGRHRLVTLFESVSLADELVLEALPAGGGGDQVRCPSVPGPNLVEEALRALRRRGWDAPPVRVEIDKLIPVAAGMGGGSADAAAALRLACELAPGRPEEVSAIAAALGADVPSQLVPGLVLGTGAGEDVEPFAPLGAHALLIVPLAHQLSTPEVYREADRLGLPRGEAELEHACRRLEAALHPAARLPAELLHNDLEPAAISLCPAIAVALEVVRDAGAEQALVCGSGPTVAGLFWGPDGPGRAQSAAARLSSAYPGAVAAEPVGAEFGAPTLA